MLSVTSPLAHRSAARSDLPLKRRIEASPTPDRFASSTHFWRKGTAT